MDNDTMVLWLHLAMRSDVNSPRFRGNVHCWSVNFLHVNFIFHVKRNFIFPTLGTLL